MNPFFWATTGGFVFGTVRNPFDPIQNLGQSVVQASLFATKTGQRLLLGAGTRVAGMAGSAATATFGSTAVGVGLGAVAGGVIGAAAGTAISSIAFGQEGKEMAIDFYTGQSDAKWYEYIPHYNAFKIVTHYGGEIIE